VESRKSSKQRYISLRQRLALSFSLLAILVIGVTITILYTRFSAGLRQNLRQRVTDIVAVAALQQNGDEFAQIKSATDPLYEKFRAQNLKIRHSDPDIAYVFTLAKDEKGLYFVVDAGSPGEFHIAQYGERYDDPSTILNSNYEAMTTATADPDIYTDGDGSFLSAYAPIFNSVGQRVGVLGVDFRATAVLNQEQQLLLQSLIIFGVALIVIALSGWFLGNSLGNPLRELTKTANRIASGDWSQPVEITANTTEIADLAQNLNTMTSTISSLVSNLEKRVAERTSELAQRSNELEAISARNERRAAQMQAIAEISHAIVSVRNLNSLLPQIANVIGDQFNFYHVGIFLLDETRQFAVLSATNSFGGQRMLERQHKLRVGGAGIIGYVTSTGTARLALDTGIDSTFFNNPDLPDTHSEIAVPLITRNQIFGALDVQSIEKNVFTEEDVNALKILADQVSVAIENARSFEQTRKSLEEADALYKQFLQQQWSATARQKEKAGYRYTVMGVTPVEKDEKMAGSITPVEKGTVQVFEDSSNTYRMVVPIRVRDEVIAVLNVQSLGANAWEKDEVDIAQAAADRIALALENARLLEESQRRASKERVIGEISSKISASVDIESIFKTAAKELGLVIQDSEVVVQLMAERDLKG
jgi:GAF domain-containing protein/HAMP domain-containing protein